MIEKAFENGKCLIAFIVCGDPDLETTAAAVREAVHNGADLIELGIPFSDPFVEGEDIQRAGQRALQGGVTTDRIFDFVKELRRDVNIPLVFMTYANVIFSYGADRFMSCCHDAGIDGVLLHDLPFEEKEDFAPICKKYGIDLISTIAPTAADRIAMIAKEAEGFLCIVSSFEKNEAPHRFRADLASAIRTVRENTEIPCVIDCGASTPEQAKAMAALSDGTVIVSPVIDRMERYGRNAPQYVGEYIATVKVAIQ